MNHSSYLYSVHNIQTLFESGLSDSESDLLHHFHSFQQKHLNDRTQHWTIPIGSKTS